MTVEEAEPLLKEYEDSIKDDYVRGFMYECVQTIPNYWYHVPASSSGKYHPNYALGDGGLLRHTVALLRFFNRLVSNDVYRSSFTDRELDLMRVACLMHDTRKCGNDDDYKISRWTRFDHPMLAAEAVRSIESKFVNDTDIEFVASIVETHMGQWNEDPSGKCKVVLPKPKNKYQKLVHLVDYLAATKGVELTFKGFTPKERIDEEYTFDTYVFTFGKYKGSKLTDVYEQHPDYIKWCKNNIDGGPLMAILKKKKL